MKVVPDQVAPWMPGGLVSLGTDGFGRSDTRERAAPTSSRSTPSRSPSPRLAELARRGAVPVESVTRAITELAVDADGPDPAVS